MKRLLKKHWRTWVLAGIVSDCILLVVSPRILASANVTISAPESISSLDGSALDADGSANGIFTVAGNLTLARGGAITCNSSVSRAPSEPCPIRIAVGGNLEMLAGSAILAENGVMDGSPVEIAVAGNFRMRGPRGVAQGSLISASNPTGSGGNISVFVTGGITTEPGSKIASDAAAEPGEITITGASTDVRGAVSSLGATTAGQAAPVAIAGSIVTGS